MKLEVETVYNDLFFMCRWFSYPKIDGNYVWFNDGPWGGYSLPRRLRFRSFSKERSEKKAHRWIKKNYIP